MNKTTTLTFVRSLTMSFCCLFLWNNTKASVIENPKNDLSIGSFDQTPTINSGGTTFFCNGESLVLTCSPAETYQWFKNGQPVSGANSQTYTASENGSYRVAVTYGEGPNGISAELFITQGNTWIGEVDNDWNLAANWSCGVVPSATDYVVIPETLDAPTISSESYVQMYSLNLSGNATLNVKSGATLEVTDVIKVASSASLILQDEASLVQINDVNNVGNVIAQKKTTPMKRYDFTYWSAPVGGQTLHNLSPNTMADKYYSYSPVIGNWVSHLNGAQVMAEATGYIVRAPQSYSTSVPAIYNAEFIGTPNNGTVQTPIIVGTSDMNLIGNPYPSAIDMDLFLTNTNNAAITEGTIYLWTHNSSPGVIPGDNTYNYTSNDYAAYNLMGGIQTSTAGNNEKPTGKVASGQCFFIKGLSNGQVTFDNSMRVAFSNDQFFRTSSQEKSRLWLNLSNNQGAFKQTLLGFMDGATDGIDRNYDGATFNANAYVDFYTLVDDKHLSIQGRALPFNENVTIPLGYTTTVPGTFTISISDFDGLFENQEVYLYDADLDLTYDLKQFTTYMFGTTMGTFNNRFELRFTDSVLANETFDSVTVAADKAMLQIRSASEMESITISDVLGKTIYKRNNIGSTEISLSDIQSTNAVLFLQIKLANGKTVVKKVMM